MTTTVTDPVRIPACFRVDPGWDPEPDPAARILDTLAAYATSRSIPELRTALLVAIHARDGMTPAEAIEAAYCEAYTDDAKAAGVEKDALLKVAEKAAERAEQDDTSEEVSL